MGMRFRAAGLDYDDSFDGGFVAFGQYRMDVADAIDPAFGLMYRAWYLNLGVKSEEGRQSCRSVVHVSDPGNVREACRTGAIRVEGAYELSAWEKEETGKTHSVHLSLDWEKFRDWTEQHVSEAARNLLFAPDTGGKWSWRECRDMHEELSGLKVDAVCYNHGSARWDMYNVHERFMKMMRHCWKRRVNLRWG